MPEKRPFDSWGRKILSSSKRVTGLRLQELLVYPCLPALGLGGLLLCSGTSKRVVAAFLAITMSSAFVIWMIHRNQSAGWLRFAVVRILIASLLWISMPVSIRVVHPRLWTRLLAKTGLGDAPASERFVGQVQNATWDGATKSIDISDIKSVSENDWPCWRGGQRNGIAQNQLVPSVWSPDRNILWTIPVSGRGHSSPIVFNNRVILTTADEELGTQGVLCFDATTGSHLWAVKIHEGGLIPIHKKNSQASSTPATDGKLIYAAFLTNHENRKGIWVTALHMDGKVEWQKFAGEFEKFEGFGASICLDDSRVIVGADNLASGFLVALGAMRGDELWRVQRSNRPSFSTPVIADIAGRRQVIFHGCGEIVSYELDTGKKLWKCDGLPEYCANTPSFDENMVYVSGGEAQRSIYAIRINSDDNEYLPQVVWKKSRNGAYVPSMLVTNGRLYVGSDSGIVSCLSALDGKELWHERIGAGFSASPTMVDGRIFWPDEQGTVHVFQDSNDLEIISKNNLDDGGMASMAVSSGHLFVRTDHRLYCIANTND